VHVTATEALIVAIAGAALGVAGLGVAVWASIRVKRVRDSQRSLLGWAIFVGRRA